MTVITVKPNRCEVVGRRLKNLRVSRHLSIQQLSAATGISPAALSYFENGKRYPSNMSVYRLSEFYCVSRKDILGY